MRTLFASASLLLLAASPALAQEASVTAATPSAAASAAPAAPASAAEPARPAKTLAWLERHVTRTVTALMQRLAESRIPPDQRSGLNQRLLAVQEQAGAAVRSGQAPAGSDVEGFSALLGKDLDAIAGAIDAATRRGS